MPTPSEQKALAFVAIVVLLGGAVRVVRAGVTPAPNPIEQQALARQATAAEVAAGEAKARQRSRSTRGAKRSRGEARGTAAAPESETRAGFPVRLGINGFPPPGPRIDTDARGGAAPPFGAVPPGSPDGRRLVVRVDLDRASVAEIDGLPGVGPSLARRLVANRDSMGAFGSLEGLERVKGMGPATIKRLSPLVTFSGRPSSRP